MEVPSGTRVEVLTAKLDRRLGHGTYLYSEPMEFLGEELPMPCILLDTGSTIYGYQCWWTHEIDGPPPPIPAMVVKLLSPFQTYGRLHGKALLSKEPWGKDRNLLRLEKWQVLEHNGGHELFGGFQASQDWLYVRAVAVDFPKYDSD